MGDIILINIFMENKLININKQTNHSEHCVSRISAALDRLENPLLKTELYVELHGFYHLPDEWIKEENDINSLQQQSP